MQRCCKMTIYYMLSRRSINTRSLSSSDFSDSYLKFTIKQNIICRATVVTELINKLTFKPIILNRSVIMTYRGKIVSKSISNINTIGTTTNCNTVTFSLLKFTISGLPKTIAIFLHETIMQIIRDLTTCITLPMAEPSTILGFTSTFAVVKLTKHRTAGCYPKMIRFNTLSF